MERNSECVYCHDSFHPLPASGYDIQKLGVNGRRHGSKDMPTVLYYII